MSDPTSAHKPYTTGAMPNTAALKDNVEMSGSGWVRKITATNFKWAGNDDTDQGTAIDFANTTWATLHGELSTFGTNCTKRIAEIDARIGKPIYAGSPAALDGEGLSLNTPPAVYVSHIPASNTSSGFVPYGRSLYNNCNHLLGQDVDLLGGIIKDVELFS